LQPGRGPGSCHLRQDDDGRAQAPATDDRREGGYRRFDEERNRVAVTHAELRQRARVAAALLQEPSKRGARLARCTDRHDAAAVAGDVVEPFHEVPRHGAA
jgi:hypothetical protein